MRPLLKGNKLTFKSLVDKLACFSIFLYIISAISCEMVEDTAFISTLAIYFVFAIGLVFITINGKIALNLYVVLYTAFCVYVFVMSASPEAPKNTGVRTAYLLFTCVVLCLLAFWISSRLSGTIPIAMAAYIIGAVILAVRIIITYGGIEGVVAFATASGEHESRLGGLLGNENAIGLFFSTGILSCMVFFIKNKRFMVKMLMSATMLALLIMVLLTGSRKALVFALVGIVLLVYWGYRKARLGKKIAAVCFLILAIATICIAINTMPVFYTINERFKTLFEGFLGNNTSYETDQMRIMMVEKGLEAFCEKPLFGHGTGYSYAIFNTYSHNNFVELLMNYGIVGFVMYYGIYVFLIAKLYKQAMKNDLYATFFLVYICTQVVLGIGWVTYYERSVQIITALAFGYLMSTKKKGFAKK